MQIQKMKASFKRRKPTEITILKKKKKAQEFNKLLYVYMTHIYIQICIEHRTVNYESPPKKRSVISVICRY